MRRIKIRRVRMPRGLYGHKTKAYRNEACFENIMASGSSDFNYNADRFVHWLLLEKYRTPELDRSGMRDNSRRRNRHSCMDDRDGKKK